jgi:hypothetical protein
MNQTIEGTVSQSGDRSETRVCYLATQRRPPEAEPSACLDRNRETRCVALAPPLPGAAVCARRAANTGARGDAAAAARRRTDRNALHDIDPPEVVNPYLLNTLATDDLRGGNRVRLRGRSEGQHCRSKEHPKGSHYYRFLLKKNTRARRTPKHSGVLIVSGPTTESKP